MDRTRGFFFNILQGVHANFEDKLWSAESGEQGGSTRWTRSRKIDDGEEERLYMSRSIISIDI